MADEAANDSGASPDRGRDSDAGRHGRGEAETVAPGSARDSVAQNLRATKGIRGDVSLNSGEEAGRPVAGPASRERYSVLGEIARGGMGAIVKLMDNDIRRPVAMKVILGGSSPGTAEAERERLERFVEEAQVTGQLEHPNIVPVHELGLDPEGRVYFTMKLVRGESLQSIIEKISDRDPEVLRKYPLSHLLQVFLKVCDALSFAHSRGVLHRDLKPDNVMVGKFGEVLVMDWGLAKVRGREDTAKDELVASIRSERETGRTLAGEVMGTPSYMPPEQAAGEVEAIDERSDVFALGGILYQILSHEAPYVGDSVAAVLTRAVKADLVPPSRRTPWNRVPPELESVCLKAMAARKERRYGSAEELIEDVRAFIDRRLVGAHRYGPFSKAARFVQRHPTGSVSAGVALLLLALGAAVSGLAIGEARAYRARAREQEVEKERQTERAELETLRRAEAERAREAAVGERNVAIDRLEKGRRASAVLRAAEAELGEIQTRLERTAVYRLEADRRALWEQCEARVEAFESSLPADSATRAAWLAAKGWLLHLGARSDEAAACFQASREADPDIPYGNLFEAMTWLARYLSLQPMPSFSNPIEGLRFGNVPEETSEMRETRARFAQRVEASSRSPVWGDSSAQDFLSALEGLRAFQSEDLSRCADGLSKALVIPEFAWIRSDLRLARAKARLLQQRYDEALLDLDQVLKAQPDRVEALLFKGLVQGYVAQALEESGQDVLPALLEIEKTFTGYVDRLQQPFSGWCNRSAIRRRIGEMKQRRGLDPEKDFAGALEDLVRADKARPGDPGVLNARCIVRTKIGEHRAVSGEDPREILRQAVEDGEEAARKSPGDPYLHAAPGIASRDLGESLFQRGQDGREWFERAIRHYDEALAAGQDRGRMLNNRGTAWRDLADARRGRGEDPEPDYGRASADLKEAVRLHPEYYNAHNNLGIVCLQWGTWKGRKGGDPVPLLEEAVVHFRKAGELQPLYAYAFFNAGNAHLEIAGERMLRNEDPEPAIRGALEALERAVAINPRLWQAHWSRARTFERFGRLDEAVSAAGKALEATKGRNADIRSDLARLERLRAGTEAERLLHSGERELGQALHARAEPLLARGLEGAPADPPPERRPAIARAWFLHARCCAQLLAGNTAPKAQRRIPDAETAARWRGKSLEGLRRALELAPKLLGEARKERQLDPIRNLPEFQALMKEGEDKLAKTAEPGDNRQGKEEKGGGEK